MNYRRARLDSVVRRSLNWSHQQVRASFAKGQITVNQAPAHSISQLVDRFTAIAVQGKLLANEKPTYILLNKPVGAVSATKDAQHKTVLDVINFGHLQQCQWRPATPKPILLKPLNYCPQQIQQHKKLHIVGRLDFNTTGLILLTNDSNWSSKISLPERKVPKQYRVQLEQAITDEVIDAFAKGIYFAYENITTQPATVNVINAKEVELTIVEGRYHQIKRMFGAFQNKVLGLHRFAVGGLTLGEDLTQGSWRYLSEQEANRVFGR